MHFYRVRMCIYLKHIFCVLCFESRIVSQQQNFALSVSDGSGRVTHMITLFSSSYINILLAVLPSVWVSHISVGSVIAAVICSFEAGIVRMPDIFLRRCS